ncbi:hypothetical protein BH23PLA1_BH23PLA1_02110 [soil metagenome]
MDEPPSLAFDEFGDLSDDHRGRIKSELVPGERLLWAARSRPRPFRFGGHRTWSAVAAGIIGLGVFFLSIGFQFLDGPFPDSDELVGLGIFLVFIGALVALVVIASLVSTRAARCRDANTFYAVTDRRAIIWRPLPKAHALEIHTIERGRVEKIHRVEYPDGSGDVIFTCPGDAQHLYNPEFTGKQLSFKDIPEVRRAEDLLRRTLFRDDAMKM